MDHQKKSEVFSPQSSIEIIEENEPNTSAQGFKLMRSFQLNPYKKKPKKYERKASVDNSLRSSNKLNQYNYSSVVYNNLQTNILPPAPEMYYPQVSSSFPDSVSPFQTLAAPTCCVPITTPAPVLVAPEKPLAVSCLSSPAYVPVTYYDNVTTSSIIESFTGDNFNEIVTDVANLHSTEEEYQNLEYYLQLPKALFPPARSLAIDPNPIIDAFCKSDNVLEHTSWILDLEFGLHKAPLGYTRPIPIYDVKYNSVHCKNSPGTIHPGFESCSQDFKSTFLHYYDSVISAWYKGYATINNDYSVENFQTFLLIPMQELGMCWP